MSAIKLCIRKLNCNYEINIKNVLLKWKNIDKKNQKLHSVQNYKISY